MNHDPVHPTREDTMTAEIRILSGARKGEQIVLDRTEFRVGDDKRCEVYFNPKNDASAKDRSVFLRLTSDGWFIRSTGSGEVLLNQTPIVRETPVRSGDLVRLSDDGPDFSFSMTSRTPSSGNQNGISASSREYRTETTAAASNGDRAAEVAEEREAHEKTLPPTPDAVRHGWNRKISAIAAAACAVLLIAAIWHFGFRDRFAGSVPPAPAAARELNPVASESIPQKVPTTSPPSIPAIEEPRTTDVAHDDPWTQVQHNLKESLFMVQVQRSGPKGDISWPFATCAAIGQHTLLTSAREALLLAEKQRDGFHGIVVNPETGFKTGIRSLRVCRKFNDLSDKPGDWIFFNLGLIETEEKLPNSIPLATPEELQDIKEGLTTACYGFPHDGGKITDFDTFQSDLILGKVYLLSNLPGTNEGPRVLEFKSKVKENMYGSPLFNRRGAIVAVYGDAAPRESVPVKDLHYATVLDSQLLQSWLRDKDTNKWVAPRLSEAKSPDQNSSQTPVN